MEDCRRIGLRTQRIIGTTYRRHVDFRSVACRMASLAARSRWASIAPMRWMLVAGSESQRWISTAARIGLGGVLLYAGVAKLLQPDEAVRAVQAYQILPPSVDDFVAYALPLIEVAIGVLLILGLGTRLAAWIAGLLMVVFIGGVASAWIRGLSIDCGCFGGGGEVPAAGKAWRYVGEILRDIGFLGLASWLVLFPTSRLALDRLGVIGTDDMAVDVEEDEVQPIISPMPNETNQERT